MDGNEKDSRVQSTNQSITMKNNGQQLNKKESVDGHSSQQEARSTGKSLNLNPSTNCDSDNVKKDPKTPPQIITRDRDSTTVKSIPQEKETQISYGKQNMKHKLGPISTYPKVSNNFSKPVPNNQKTISKSITLTTDTTK